jgi:hypothetical protein
MPAGRARCRCGGTNENCLNCSGSGWVSAPGTLSIPVTDSAQKAMIRYPARSGEGVYSQAVGGQALRGITLSRAKGKTRCWRCSLRVRGDKLRWHLRFDCRGERRTERRVPGRSETTNRSKPLEVRQRAVQRIAAKPDTAGTTQQVGSTGQGVGRSSAEKAPARAVRQANRSTNPFAICPLCRERLRRSRLPSHLRNRCPRRSSVTPEREDQAVSARPNLPSVAKTTEGIDAVRAICITCETWVPAKEWVVVQRHPDLLITRHRECESPAKERVDRWIGEMRLYLRYRPSGSTPSRQRPGL